jgi:O-antigen ligase
VGGVGAGVSHMDRLAPGRPLERWGWPAAAAGAAMVLAYGAATVPLVTAGLVLGTTVFLLALTWPLVVVGAMLAIGAVDLSFVTGGQLLREWGGIDMNGLRLIGVVVALSAILVVDRSAARLVLGRHARWYVLFLAYAALTLAVSAAQLDGARLLLKLAYPLLLFIAVLAVVRSREDLERLMDWTLIGAAAIALVVTPILILAGLYQFEEFGRMMARPGAQHQNPLSFYMLAMMLIAFARFAVRGQRRYLVLAGLFGIWLVLAMTRITLAAAVAAFMAVALYAAWRDRDYRLPAAVAVILLLVGIPLVPLVLERTFGTMPSVGELLELVRDPVALYHRMNLQGRELVWAVAWQAFLGNPVFGLGLGTSTAHTIAALRIEGPAVLHNEYLRLAVDTGLVGVALFFTAVLAWLRAALRAARAPGLAREFALPAGAGIVAWAVIALTDNPFDYYASFTQYLAFLTAGAVWLAGGEAAGGAGRAGADPAG